MGPFCGDFIMPRLQAVVRPLVDKKWQKSAIGFSFLLLVSLKVHQPATHAKVSNKTQVGAVTSRTHVLRLVKET